MQNGQKLKGFLFAGDYDSIEDLIREHEDSLYGLCRRLAGGRGDADDLYQQTWLKAIQNAKSYRQKSFRNWLYTICINTYRDNCRKSRYRERFTNEGMDAQTKEYAIASATDGVSAENVALDNYMMEQLKDNVSRLPDKHRLPVVLHYFEDMDYNECAQALGIPIGTVKSRLSAAKKKLQGEMEKSGIV